MSPGPGGPPSRFLSFETSAEPATTSSAPANDVAPNDVAPKELAPNDVAPKELAPNDVASSAVDLEAPERAHPGFVPLGPFPNERHAREAALVLTSMSIEHALHHASSLSGSAYFTGGYYLLVRERDEARARKTLARYEEENRDWPPKRVRERPRYGGFPIIALAFVALVVFAWVTGPSKSESRYFLHGASVSSLVLSSQPFRAVTALTLHGDGAHVMGNLLSGALFGRAVERRLGPGLAGFGIVAAGAIGNYVNAAYYGLVRHEEHASIGASTAVLGAIGILAATQLLLKTSDAKRRWYDVVAPIAGGLALLGSIGSGPESDLGAHGFGFLAGLGIGALVALVIRRRAWGWALQLGAGAAALGLIGGSWALALVH